LEYVKLDLSGETAADQKVANCLRGDIQGLEYVKLDLSGETAADQKVANCLRDLITERTSPRIG
jgi:hypothetical protein